jgi:hypothetical protein
MANTKITELSADAAPTSDDLVVTVNDPAGTPVNKKVTAGNLVQKAHGVSNGIVEVTAGVMGVASNNSVLQGTTASFTTADETKLDAIEAGADVTDATNVDSAGAVMNSDTTTAGMSFVVDEDDMTSNSATKVPTQQSVKAYVDASGGGGGSTVPKMRLDLISGFVRGDGTASPSHVIFGSGGTGASVTVNNPKGLALSTGTTSTGYSYLYFHMGSSSNGITNNIFGKNMSAYFHVAPLGDAGDHKMFIGYGASWETPSDAGTTYKLIGFRFVRDAGATIVYAVNSSGTTETTTNVTSSLDGFSAGDYNKPTLFWYKVSATDIKFYHNFTLVATHTTNLPSGAATETKSGLGILVTNNSDGTSNNLLYIKQAYMDFDLV